MGVFFFLPRNVLALNFKVVEILQKKNCWFTGVEQVFGLLDDRSVGYD